MPLVGQKIETTGDNFSHRVRRGHLLADKTMMLKEFLAGSDVSLILRPRRSGKSLNISMLQHFSLPKSQGEKRQDYLMILPLHVKIMDGCLPSIKGNIL
jgi:hypothetical protein